jgi:hypothetical protein
VSARGRSADPFDDADAVPSLQLKPCQRETRTVINRDWANDPVRSNAAANAEAGSTTFSRSSASLTRTVN